MAPLSKVYAEFRSLSMGEEKFSVSDLDAISLAGKVLECKIIVSDYEFLNISNNADFLDHLKKRMATNLALEILKSYAVFTRRDNPNTGHSEFISRVIIVPKEAPTQFFKNPDVKKTLLKL